ncbi:hypothetical protein FisN_5Hh437 [Fistulifera solaris]|jgi:hypothetical protein|uniref:Uncharacterized protein n=1 Tax=Fistulifera solaris TaxID=1519565 RepID=A0A1Z5JT70_FISSO|nr:hypothetical protein FisN_5Hh437 [Fistulifera solaris]|eukprot:GAX17052.1 hypothetical protein FisN_5Hh437 [Fistulifera solaris]
MTKSTPPKIPVIIVESHHHALEHIHFILRRQKLLLTSWSMLHWDAHPDLACPRCPAKHCFRPHDTLDEHESLYDALDATSSGIAEWILPLVLAARLQHIQWIRPLETSMQQLPDGDFTLHVGAWSPTNNTPVESFLDLPHDALLKVNWSVPYYQDDDDVREKLLLPQELQLLVSSIPNQERLQPTYGFDVCLDYFYCHNPFVEDEQLASLLHRSIPCCNYGNSTSSNHIQWMQRFQTCWNDIIKRPESQEEINELTAFFEDKEDAFELFASIQQYRIDRKALPSEMANILTMPHDGSNSNRMTERLHHFSANLPVACPFFISVARSSFEGFTPVSVTEDLQESVLNILHEKYCGCRFPMDASHCRFQLVRDYGEWEGSTFSN